MVRVMIANGGCEPGGFFCSTRWHFAILTNRPHPSRTLFDQNHNPNSFLMIAIRYDHQASGRLSADGFIRLIERQWSASAGCPAMFLLKCLRFECNSCDRRPDRGDFPQELPSCAESVRRRFCAVDLSWPVEQSARRSRCMQKCVAQHC